MAKPSKLPAWDTTEVNSVEPDSTHQDEGWLAPGGVPEKPPFQTFNHWMNAVWKWIKEFAQQGVVEWDGATVYQIDDITKGSDGRLYSSLIGTNINKDPLLNPAEWIDIQWRKQTTTHDMTSDADYTLTATQNKYGRIVIVDTGTVLTAARNIIVDNIEKDFIVQNDTLQDLTVKTSAGTGILVQSGFSTSLYDDKTNVINSSTPLDTRLNIADEKYAGQVAGEEILKLNGVNIKSQSTAYVNFDGTTGTIRDSRNIASVVRTAVGQYTITFKETMDNANYSCTGGARNASTSFSSLQIAFFKSNGSTHEAPTTTGFKIHTSVQGSTNESDGDYIMIHIDGGKN